jgi:hypothetical protein
MRQPRIIQDKETGAEFLELFARRKSFVLIVDEEHEQIELMIGDDLSFILKFVAYDLYHVLLTSLLPVIKKSHISEQETPAPENLEQDLFKKLGEVHLGTEQGDDPNASQSKE